LLPAGLAGCDWRVYYSRHNLSSSSGSSFTGTCRSYPEYFISTADFDEADQDTSSVIHIAAHRVQYMIGTRRKKSKFKQSKLMFFEDKKVFAQDPVGIFLLAGRRTARCTQ